MSQLQERHAAGGKSARPTSVPLPHTAPPPHTAALHPAAAAAAASLLVPTEQPSTAPIATEAEAHGKPDAADSLNMDAPSAAEAAIVSEKPSAAPCSQATLPGAAEAAAAGLPGRARSSGTIDLCGEDEFSAGDAVPAATPALPAANRCHNECVIDLCSDSEQEQQQVAQPQRRVPCRGAGASRCPPSAFGATALAVAVKLEPGAPPLALQQEKQQLEKSPEEQMRQNPEARAEAQQDCQQQQQQQPEEQLKQEALPQAERQVAQQADRLPDGSSSRNTGHEGGSACSGGTNPTGSCLGGPKEEQDDNSLSEGRQRQQVAASREQPEGLRQQPHHGSASPTASLQAQADSELPELAAVQATVHALVDACVASAAAGLDRISVDLQQLEMQPLQPQQQELPQPQMQPSASPGQQLDLSPAQQRLSQCGEGIRWWQAAILGPLPPSAAAPPAVAPAGASPAVSSQSAAPAAPAADAGTGTAHAALLPAASGGAAPAGGDGPAAGSADAAAIVGAAAASSAAAPAQAGPAGAAGGDPMPDPGDTVAMMHWLRARIPQHLLDEYREPFQVRQRWRGSYWQGEGVPGLEMWEKRPPLCGLGQAGCLQLER